MSYYGQVQVLEDWYFWHDPYMPPQCYWRSIGGKINTKDYTFSGVQHLEPGKMIHRDIEYKLGNPSQEFLNMSFHGSLELFDKWMSDTFDKQLPQRPEISKELATLQVIDESYNNPL